MTVPISFHSSQFPEAVKRQMAESLKTRLLRPKFHYTSYRQAQRWLELHQNYSPSRKDEVCRSMYDRIFAETAATLTGKSVQVIGLGCGGGAKDLQLLRALKSVGCPLRYVPCDVSHALVLTARQTVLQALPELTVRPLVADLLEAQDLGDFWEKDSSVDEVRVFSFLGMIPNFEPAAILNILKSWLRPPDRLILSANLFAGENEERGLEDILPQYDNALTRRWLTTALDDLDIPSDSYEVSFDIKKSRSNPELKRIVAEAFFSKTVEVLHEGERYSFNPEDCFEIFFSNRYSPALFEKGLKSLGLTFEPGQLLDSGEEGVWLARLGG